ncbi:calpain-14-like isoform X2 [Acipenser ruthenus]|uniref:calpain-14-like isoform X2 n=1 Tax=Acipenser ruthenus TaxID=7906 RepID=UPI00274203E7|nr:calpain-14-like isoform X2 [Acipenser ruthenus]
MYSKTSHKEKMDSDLNLQFSQLSVSHVNSHKKVFAKYSSQGQEINANDLQRLLNDSLKGNISTTGGFSFDACKGILAVMDLNANGKLNTSEFEELWKKITDYQEIFNQCDEKSSGLLNLHEMKNAILASERFRQRSHDGIGIYLQEEEWMFYTMYS